MLCRVGIHTIIHLTFYNFRNRPLITISVSNVTDTLLVPFNVTSLKRTESVQSYFCLPVAASNLLNITFI